MVVKVNTTEMMEKMQEVSSALLKQDDFIQLREMIEEFNKDHESIKQYEEYIARQDSLHQKEQQGVCLSHKETKEFKQKEAALYRNEVIRKFIFAKQEFSKIHELVSQYFVKTIEFNRLPELDEINVNR